MAFNNWRGHWHKRRDVKDRNDRAGKRSRIYAPIVQFIANNRTVVGDDGIFTSSLFPYKIGDKVTIYYNPVNISEFLIIGEKKGILESQEMNWFYWYFL